MGLDQLNISHEIARKLLLRHGATFRLINSGNKGSERILPFDPLPIRGSFVGPSNLESKLDWYVEIT